MARTRIDRIRERVRLRQYDMTAHAMEEMAEDGLDILDIETAILNGANTRVEKDDPRGIRYILEGLAMDEMTPIGVVGRFTRKDRFLIITVYEIKEREK